jgi:predicted CXXCH cytochrome family protein
LGKRWQKPLLALLLLAALGLLLQPRSCGEERSGAPGQAGRRDAGPAGPKPEPTTEELRQLAAEAAAAHKAQSRGVVETDNRWPDGGNEVFLDLRVKGQPPDSAAAPKEQRKRREGPQQEEEKPAPEKVATQAAPTAPSKVEPKSEAIAALPPSDTSCGQCHGKLTGGPKPHEALTSVGCSGCHAPDSSAPGTCKSNTHHWKLTSDPVQVCTKCHDRLGAGALHASKSADLKGRACTACHDAHTSPNKALLKKPALGELCASCHKPPKTLAHGHAPAMQGDCNVCHATHASQEPGRLKGPAKEICESCHKKEQLVVGKVSHTPFREGQCTSCHDSHGSANPALLKEAGARLCQSCHAPEAQKVEPKAQIDLGKATVHAPASAADGCQQCHTQKHGGSNRQLLTVKGGVAETCYKCHERLDQVEHPHGAVKLGRCTGCHDPHSSGEKGLLKGTRQSGVCFNCHSDDLTDRRVIHKPLKEKGCLACHDPHGTDNPSDLTADGKELCFQCHKRVDEVKQPHAALGRYGCTACHDPHGAPEDGLLLKPVNQLCIGCHEKQKDGRHVTTLVPKGHKISGGRDQHKRGRDFTCVSCHDPHGTDRPRGFYFGSSAKDMCTYCHSMTGPKKPTQGM